MKILRNKDKHVILLNGLMVDDDVFEDDMASYSNLSLFCLFDQLSLDRYTLMVIYGEQNHYGKQQEEKEKKMMMMRRGIKMMSIEVQSGKVVGFIIELMEEFDEDTEEGRYACNRFELFDV